MDKNSCESLGKFEYSAEVLKMILTGNVYSDRLEAVIFAFYSKIVHSIFSYFYAGIKKSWLRFENVTTNEEIVLSTFRSDYEAECIAQCYRYSVHKYFN